MKGLRIGRLAIGIVLVSLALAWLVYAGTRSNLVYYYEVDEVLAILGRCGAREHTLGEARHFRDRAAAGVNRLQASPQRRDQLRTLIEAVIVT